MAEVVVGNNPEVIVPGAGPARVLLPTPDELDWEGEWVADRYYDPGDIVYRDGSSYRASTVSVGADPLVDSVAWEFLARKGEKGDKGDQGEQGLPGAGQTVEFEFQMPESEWIISHNLEARPSITTLDTSGMRIYGEETYIDENTIRVRWFANGSPIAIAGKAILN